VIGGAMQPSVCMRRLAQAGAAMSPHCRAQKLSDSLFWRREKSVVRCNEECDCLFIFK
jgi:hypothetical protein